MKISGTQPDSNLGPQHSLPTCNDHGYVFIYLHDIQPPWLLGLLLNNHLRIDLLISSFFSISDNSDFSLFTSELADPFKQSFIVVQFSRHCGQFFFPIWRHFLIQSVWKTWPQLVAEMSHSVVNKFKHVGQAISMLFSLKISTEKCFFQILATCVVLKF